MILCKTVLEVCWRSVKLTLLLEIEHVVPESMQNGLATRVMSRPLVIPCKTVLEVGCRSVKSALILEIEHVVPKLMQMGWPPGLKLIRRWLCLCKGCQAHK